MIFRSINAGVIEMPDVGYYFINEAFADGTHRMTTFADGVVCLQYIYDPAHPVITNSQFFASLAALPAGAVH